MLDEIDHLLARRAEQAKAVEERVALWQQSVERYHAERREARRHAWRTFHLEQAEHIETVAAELAADHREKAEALGESAS